MKTLTLAAIRCPLIFTAVAALSIAYPASVQAVPTTYRYTGHPFTDVSGPYTTSMFVTAMVTLADALPPNFFNSYGPTAFTLFDGVQTLTNTTPGLGTLIFAFGTNALGEINSWVVIVQYETGYGIATHRTPGFPENRLDYGNTSEGIGLIRGGAGVWRPGSATPDGGSTLLLLTLTLMALGVAARQFKRAAA